MKFSVNFLVFGCLYTSVYGLAIKEEKPISKNDVVVVYPSAEVMDDDKFQSRSSDSFAASPQAIDVPTVNRPNIFNHNGKQEKLAHCQQNQACIAQFSCSDRPFEYGTACESSTWSAESPDLGIGWSFNANTGKCQSFYYGGCDGTLNIFKTQMECSSLCEPNGMSKPRGPGGMMSPVTDFFKSVVDKVNNIPTWIQERLGRRRLDNKVDNVSEGSKQVEVKADLEDGTKQESECWIPVFCSMQKKVQSWFQERMGSRRFHKEKSMRPQQHVPSFGRRRL